MPSMPRVSSEARFEPWQGRSWRAPIDDQNNRVRGSNHQTFEDFDQVHAVPHASGSDGRRFSSSAPSSAGVMTRAHMCCVTEQISAVSAPRLKSSGTYFSARGIATIPASVRHLGRPRLTLLSGVGFLSLVWVYLRTNTDQ
jgi:hypothetical protein